MLTNMANGHVIELEPETHTYRVDGVIKPGANEIIKAIGMGKDWSGVDTFYRDRGIAVHSAINLYLQKDLDESSLDPAIVPYFEQFVTWFKSIPEVGGLVMTEKPLYSPRYDFCGSVDLIMNGVIWDYKCSKRLDKEAERQYRRIGSAYRTLVRDQMGFELPFKVLLLTGEGPAVVKSWACPFVTWDAVMTLYGDEREQIKAQDTPNRNGGRATRNGKTG